MKQHYIFCINTNANIEKMAMVLNQMTEKLDEGHILISDKSTDTHVVYILQKEIP